jgi:peptidoglycan hydrolase CwlO-like protein
MKWELSMFNKKWIYFSLIALVLVAISAFSAHAIGYNKASVLLKDKKVVVREIDGEIKEWQKELEIIEEKVEAMEDEESSKQAELDGLQIQVDEATEIISQKVTIQKELDELGVQVKGKKDELKKLSEEIANKQSEIDTLNKGILVKKKEPRNLVAGVFIAGKDIAPGRYKVEPVNGFGNYFVNGGSKVNIILGRGDDLFLPEYVFELDEGDEIEATLSVKYTLVE